MKKSRLGSITYLTFPVFRYRVSKERDAYQKPIKPGIHTLSQRVYQLETLKTIIQSSVRKQIGVDEGTFEGLFSRARTGYPTEKKSK